jgi:hypothetical protein
MQKVAAQPTFDDASSSIPQLDQSDRWLDGTLSIAKGRVVLTPLESREIHCLDLKDGRPIWTKARDDGLFVACITDELVIVVGRNAVRAHRLNDGQVAWTLPLAGSFPAGRGVFAGERYYLPVTSAAVLEIELPTGTLAALHKSPRELPAGNLIWHRGLFISQGPATLEVFDERESLVEQVREAGLPVELRIEGEQAPLPPGIDLSAYRIVQEALTNTLKHAGRAQATIVVRYEQAALELEISDNGTSTPAGMNGSGHGLIGMRERAALYGGALEAGARDGGGYVVRARLPLAAGARR